MTAMTKTFIYTLAVKRPDSRTKLCEYNTPNLRIKILARSVSVCRTEISFRSPSHYSNIVANCETGITPPPQGGGIKRWFCS